MIVVCWYLQLPHKCPTKAIDLFLTTIFCRNPLILVMPLRGIEPRTYWLRIPDRAINGNNK